MSNDFYTPTGSPATASPGSSAIVRAEFDAVRQAFDKLPSLSVGALPLFTNVGCTALEAANVATAQSRLGIISNNELNGISNLNAVGIIARTGNGTYASRTLSGPAAGISVANGNGVSGHPTLSLANDLSALEGLAATGIAVRTGNDTWAQRALIAPAAGITVSNNDGVAGNPTIALANDLNALEGLNNNGIAVRTGDDTWAVRTITGTANQISVANGNGVPSNPTLSLPNPLNLPGNVAVAGTLTPSGGLTPAFESAEQTITLSADTGVAHALGRIPKLTRAYLRCKTTDLGYAVNDEVPLDMGSTDGTNAIGISLYTNSTNIGFMVSASRVDILNRTNGLFQAITLGNWKIVLRAW